MSPFPSAVQIGLFGPPARGDELSPITKPSMSKSKFAVMFRGFAFGERSSTHRSGSVYELIGWFVAATNATSGAKESGGKVTRHQVSGNAQCDSGSMQIGFASDPRQKS